MVRGPQEALLSISARNTAKLVYTGKNKFSECFDINLQEHIQTSILQNATRQIFLTVV